VARKQTKTRKSKEKPPVESPEGELQVTALTLHGLQFARIGARSDARNVEWEVAMGTAFVSPMALAVELSIKARCEDAFEAAISYRAVFNRNVPFQETEDADMFWRRIVAHVSPVVLMPYVRATFSWLVMQAGFPSIVLPLVNPQQLVPLENVVLPMKQSS
jgi:preprotein translocase subunit SecB